MTVKNKNETDVKCCFFIIFFTFCYIIFHFSLTFVLPAVAFYCFSLHVLWLDSYS
jgi:hypothetical protein